MLSLQRTWQNSVTASEIQDGVITQAKLAFGVGGGGAYQEIITLRQNRF